MNAPVIGRTEAVNGNAMTRLTAPRRTTEGAPKPAIDASKAESKPDEEMKDDEKPKAEAKKKAAAKDDSDN
jgi:hypothetical protein